MAKPIYRRVAIFYSHETHVLDQGEWFRDAGRSGVPLDQQINEFAKEESVEVVFASPPNIKTVEIGETLRTHFVAVSVIFIPQELIQDAQEEEYRQQQEGQRKAGTISGAETIAEFLRYARSQPGRGGPGSEIERAVSSLLAAEAARKLGG